MRISIDLDIEEGFSNLDPLKIFCILKYLFPDSKVEIERTYRGFHIKAVGDEIKEIPIKKRVLIRATLGDDHLRVEYDKMKLQSNLNLYYLVDTLFSMKRSFDKQLHISEGVNPFALPWISHLPAKNYSSSKASRTKGKGIA